jgi:hypothetical protein
MARRREEKQARLLEHGEIGFYYRPRLDTREIQSADGVQRMLIVLCPENRRRYRVIAVGRKRMATRFWGFVDLVLDAPQDLHAALGAQIYGTRTSGVRHVPAAVPAASGTYTLSWQNGHGHLEWRFKRVYDIDLTDGEAIVTVANPDPSAWGLEEPPSLQFELFDDVEVHVTTPATFPPAMQSRFGDQRYLPLDSLDYIDHPGTELVFATR